MRFVRTRLYVASQNIVEQKNNFLYTLLRHSFIFQILFRTWSWKIKMAAEMNGDSRLSFCSHCWCYTNKLRDNSNMKIELEKLFLQRSSSVSFLCRLIKLMQYTISGMLTKEQQKQIINPFTNLHIFQYCQRVEFENGKSINLSK